MLRPKQRRGRKQRLFPQTCKAGQIVLEGLYEIKEARTIHGACQLVGKGTKGATILLHAALTFRGAFWDALVLADAIIYDLSGSPKSGRETISFVGGLRFIGQRPLQQPCVTVESTLNVGSDHADRISFANCHNEASFIR